MGLQKGTTNNKNGRPKGRKNKITQSHRQFLDAFLNKNRRKLQADWNKLDAYQRLQMFEKLLSYSIPKMSTVDINSLSNEQLEFLIQTLNEKYEK
jgi:hypothetical protein